MLSSREKCPRCSSITAEDNAGSVLAPLATSTPLTRRRIQRGDARHKGAAIRQINVVCAGLHASPCDVVTLPLKGPAGMNHGVCTQRANACGKIVRGVVECRAFVRGGVIGDQCARELFGF